MLVLLKEDRAQAQVRVFKARVSAAMSCDAVPEKVFFLVMLLTYLKKYFWKKKPTGNALCSFSIQRGHHLLNAHKSASFEEKCCSPRRFCRGEVPMAEFGQQWSHINPLPHALHFLSEEQSQVLCWKFVLFNRQKSNSTKLSFAPRTLQYHLSLCFDPWIFFSQKPLLIINFLINNFCAVQNFKSGRGLCFV